MRARSAIKKFLEGYNCAQSVLYPFCDDLQVDEDTALKITCGFGGGMGGNGEVCGAITGGIIAIGLRYGRAGDDDITATQITYSKTRKLIKHFSIKHGTVICRQLLDGCDLTTEEGLIHFKENNFLKKKCKVCVESAVKILEPIIIDNAKYKNSIS